MELMVFSSVNISNAYLLHFNNWFDDWLDLKIYEESFFSFLVSFFMSKFELCLPLILHYFYRYICPNPVWACAWDESNCNYVYAGLQNGWDILYILNSFLRHVFTKMIRVLLLGPKGCTTYFNYLIC